MTVRESINDLTKAISEKENKVRIDKRKKLIEKLKDYLAIFFKDKYDFDGAVKIYAQICLQGPADLKSAGNRVCPKFCVNTEMRCK